MVDQMRASNFWLPTGGQSAINAAIPNITALMNMSWVFPNYFVAATKCTPSRATLLTGLYPPQTSIFRTQNLTDPVVSPSLLPLNPRTGTGGGFPTIGEEHLELVGLGQAPKIARAYGRESSRR